MDAHGYGAPLPISDAHTEPPTGVSSGWALTGHICKTCLNRLLTRDRIYLCAGCEKTGPTAKAICGCGIGDSGPAAARTLWRCMTNPNQGPASPARVVIGYGYGIGQAPAPEVPVAPAPVVDEEEARRSHSPPGSVIAKTKEILALVERGKTQREIARELGISIASVSNIKKREGRTKPRSPAKPAFAAIGRAARI